MLLFFVWMILIIVPLVAFVVMHMRFNDHLVARTGQGLTSTQLTDLAGRDIVGAFRYSLRAFPARAVALFTPSGYPALERDRRVTVKLLAIALAVILAPFPYVLLRAKGFSDVDSVLAEAFLAVTIYVIVVSAFQLIPGRRSVGQQRLAGVLGTLSGIGVLIFWYWFFVLNGLTCRRIPDVER